MFLKFFMIWDRVRVNRFACECPFPSIILWRGSLFHISVCPKEFEYRKLDSNVTTLKRGRILDHRGTTLKHRFNIVLTGLDLLLQEPMAIHEDTAFVLTALPTASHHSAARLCNTKLSREATAWHELQPLQLWLPWICGICFVCT